MTESVVEDVEAILDELLKTKKIKCLSQGSGVYVRANRYTNGMAPDPRCNGNTMSKWRTSCLI